MGKPQRLTEEDLSLFPTCSWDLECTNLSADFGVMLVAGIKPFGKPTKIFRADDYTDDRSDDSRIVAAVADELSKYTVAVGWNTVRFDTPYLISRMIAHNLNVRKLSSIKHLDLIYAARYRMRLRGNSLAMVREHLGTEDEKTPLTGRVWVQAAAGNKKALDKIVEHNIQDCKVLEQVAKRLAHLIDIKFTLIR